MPDSPRIEDLRRRVQRDPASIAFAQLAEEYRRAGRFNEAVATCRAGLSIHPGYLSARVTLGRALLELGELDEAQEDLEHVLASAPENLAAIRGVAEIHHRRGDLSKALDQYRAALALARNDPDLQETVNDLERQITPSRGPDPADGLSLDQMRDILAAHGGGQQFAVGSHQSPVDDAAIHPEGEAPEHLGSEATDHLANEAAEHLENEATEHPGSEVTKHVESEAAKHLASVHPETLARLESFLNAVYAARADRSA